MSNQDPWNSHDQFGPYGSNSLPNNGQGNQSPYSQQHQGYESAPQYPAYSPNPQQPAAQFGSAQPARPMYPYVPQKSRALAAVLAFFLGGLGVHNFYLGYTKRGTTQLIATIVGALTTVLLVGFLILSVVGIWVLIEFILILLGTSPFDRDGYGNPL